MNITSYSNRVDKSASDPNETRAHRTVITLDEAVFNEKLRHNILSQGKLLSQGCTVSPTIDRLYLPDSNEFIVIDHDENGLMWIEFTLTDIYKMLTTHKNTPTCNNTNYNS